MPGCDNCGFWPLWGYRLSSTQSWMREGNNQIRASSHGTMKKSKRDEEGCFGNETTSALCNLWLVEIVDFVHVRALNNEEVKSSKKTSWQKGSLKFKRWCMTPLIRKEHGSHEYMRYKLLLLFQYFDIHDMLMCAVFLEWSDVKQNKLDAAWFHTCRNPQKGNKQELSKMNWKGKSFMIQKKAINRWKVFRYPLVLL